MVAKVIVLREEKFSRALSEFETFWRNYPRKKSKLDAMKAWEQTKELRPPIEELLAAIFSQVEKHGDHWRGENLKFCPYPATWLRAGGWMDED